MDDQILIEPDVGTRPHESSATAEEAAKLILGDGSINAQKNLEEGSMETKKICWGLLYDTTKESVEMPEPKIEKASYMLMDPELDYGRESINFKFLE